MWHIHFHDRLNQYGYRRLKSPKTVWVLPMGHIIYVQLKTSSRGIKLASAIRICNPCYWGNIPHNHILESALELNRHHKDRN